MGRQKRFSLFIMGVSCEMDTINAIANKYKLYVVEDSAQGVISKYKGRPVGSLDFKPLASMKLKI